MTPIGYGDIRYCILFYFFFKNSTCTLIPNHSYLCFSATTEPERAVAVLCMLVGAAFFAWGCGKMTRALTDNSQVSTN